MSQELIKGPYAWRKFGSSWMLTTLRGGAYVVLDTERKGMQGACLTVRDERGFLVELTPEHPVARLLEASWELLEACEADEKADGHRAACLACQERGSCQQWLDLRLEAQMLRMVALEKARVAG